IPRIIRDKMKRTSIILPVILMLCWRSYGQQTLKLSTEQNSFMPGDTISLLCEVPEWENTQRLGTVNIVIESLDHKHLWKFRYPVIDGYYEPSFVLPPDLPGGFYVVSAELQPVYFQLTGKLLNRQREDSIRYSLQLEDNTLIAGTLALNKEGEFRLPRHTFSGAGTLFFTPYHSGRNTSQPVVAIKTPLDSAYTSIASARLLLPVGDTDGQLPPNLFSTDTSLITNKALGTLDNVVVRAQAKTRLEKFEEENTTGFFKSDRATVFSGLDGDFYGYLSILEWLPGRVAGLNVVKETEEFGLYNVSWRGEPTAFFIDEMQVDLQAIYSFPPSEIAMLKVFPPPFLGMPLGSGGGAIAIYSKRATLPDKDRNRNKFIIQGFSPTISTLKPVAAN
ncbi:MAG TPA: hypothetical protein VK907_07455, partial [Phnomibacter sp.]|nr:hypothetical protein [Phnomibacter sp.]